MPNLGGWELVILIVVVLLLFGAKKLPDMARSVGQSARIFKGEMKGMKNEGADGAAQTNRASLPQAQPGPTAPSGTATQPEKPATAPQDTSQPADPVRGEGRQ